MFCADLSAKRSRLSRSFFRQVVDVGNVLDQAALDQLCDQRFAHAVDVHDAARGEVQNGSEQFRGAVGVDAAVVDLAFGANDFRSAHRALLGHHEFFCAARMIFVFDDLRDFRNHVAAALDLHPVADLHAEALDLVHVVQGRVADGGAADRNRSEHRNRSKFSRAPDLHANVFELRDSGARRVFVGDRPARGFAGEAEFVLQSGAVDFDDDAVDLVRQRVALTFPLLDECQTSSIEWTSLRFG